MIELTSQQRNICIMQAKLFETSIEVSACGSAVFVRRFMNSNIAKRLDDGSYIYESDTVEQAIHEVDAEYNNTIYGSEKYSPSEMHWMGYIYRYLCFTTQITSKRAYKVIGARELRALYQPYHSLDINQAIERIMEAHGCKSAPQDSISYGVDILKKIRQHSGSEKNKFEAR